MRYILTGSLLAMAPPPFVNFFAFWMNLKSWQKWICLLLLTMLFILGPILILVVRGLLALALLGKMILLTIISCLVPSFTFKMVKDKRRAVRVLLDTLLFIVLLTLFNIWILGPNSIGVWVLYALLLILMLEVGGHLVEWQKNSYKERIVQSDLLTGLQENIGSFEKMYHNELALYLSMPFGLIGGTVFGLLRGLPVDSIMALCLQAVLILSSLILAYFLLVSFLHMSESLLNERKIRIKGKGNSFREVEVDNLLAFKKKTGDNQEEQKEFDLIFETSLFRRLYLYDATHNLVLLFSFLFFTIRSFGIVISNKYVVGSFLAGALIFNQLPYLMGQSLLRSKFLKQYAGVKLSEMTEKLDKYAPLLPKFEFLASLTATGTAGGVFYYLIDQFVKTAFK